MKTRRRECPVCGRVTVYRLAWTPVAGNRPPRIFRPHVDPLTKVECAQIGEQRRYA